MKGEGEGREACEKEERDEEERCVCEKKREGRRIGEWGHRKRVSCQGVKY